MVRIPYVSRSALSQAWSLIKERRKFGKHRCIVCFKYFKHAEINRLPCEHTYCSICLRKTFLMATTCSERPLPPRCCNIEIPYATVKSYLSRPELDTYTEELKKRTPNPIFCADKNCGAFIPPDNIKELEDLALCDKCHNETCTICLMEKHADTAPCSRVAERGETRYRRLAGRQGWRECEGCGMMLSRDSGCPHVTCRCGTDAWLAF